MAWRRELRVAGQTPTIECGKAAENDRLYRVDTMSKNEGGRPFYALHLNLV
jgi:hypothetical protein